MVRIERTRDWLYVREVITHHKIWPHVSDGTGDRSTWQPEASEVVYWLVPYASKPLGVFMVHPHSAVCFEVHTALLPLAYGELAAQAAKALIAWVFENTSCRKLITAVPVYNRLARRFAIHAGMQEEGVNRKSFLRDNEMIDQVMLGITHEEFKCQLLPS